MVCKSRNLTNSYSLAEQILTHKSLELYLRLLNLCTNHSEAPTNRVIGFLYIAAASVLPRILLMSFASQQSTILSVICQMYYTERIAFKCVSCDSWIVVNISIRTEYFQSRRVEYKRPSARINETVINKLACIQAFETGKDAIFSLF